MSEYLPYGELEWLKNVDEFDVMSISKKSEIGYCFKVDLKCHDELHELHNDYSLAIENLAASSDMLSKYCKEIDDKYGINIGDIKKINPKFRQQNLIRASLQKSSVVFVLRNETG